MMSGTEKRAFIEDKFSVEQLEQASSRSSAAVEISAEERKLVRKIDLRIMPILSAVYLCACELL